ncbi:MAG: endonuclease V [Nitrospiraceae bacterium]|nr:MAG: endonuclease V [Nitrospiraceae bacterium]
MKTPRTVQEARQIQLRLQKQVRIAPLRRRPAFIAGADAAFSATRVFAAASLFTYPDLRHVEDAYADAPLLFPYIPGLLTFREGPAILKAVRNLSRKPDVVLFDGQGIAHPAGLGIASHLGVLLGIPSIGCAKSRLVGVYAEPGTKRGRWTDLVYRSAIAGVVLRSRDNVKPLFLSPGHLIDLQTTIEIVVQSLGRFRLPEPLRKADALSKQARK